MTWPSRSRTTRVAGHIAQHLHAEVLRESRSTAAPTRARAGPKEGTDSCGALNAWPDLLGARRRSVSPTRDRYRSRVRFPPGLGWVAQPFVESVPRQVAEIHAASFSLPPSEKRQAASGVGDEYALGGDGHATGGCISETCKPLPHRSGGKARADMDGLLLAHARVASDPV